MSGKKSGTQENPFSFKAYLESGVSNDDEDSEAKGTRSETTKKSTKEINPFSFKNFLAEGEDEEASVSEPIDLPDIPTPEPPLLDTTSQSLLDNLPEIAAAVTPTVIDLVPDVFDDQEDIRKLVVKQREKIERLERKLRSLIDKEENENKTLAMVAAQVEKNLEEANKRRVAAESALELAKLENTQLKAQVLALSNENVLLKAATSINISGRGGVGLFRTIGDIAVEINEAAKAAESSLNYLGSGVNTLRMIASRLESLEKISEIV